jgi:hypothetical protein
MSRNKRKRSLAVIPELLKKLKNQGILVPVTLQPLTSGMLLLRNGHILPFTKPESYSLTDTLIPFGSS